MPTRIQQNAVLNVGQEGQEEEEEEGEEGSEERVLVTAGMASARLSRA